MRNILLALPAALLPLAGCVDTPAPTAPAPAVVPAAYVESGTIIGMRMVQVQMYASEDDMAAGALAGGIIGGIIGNQFGSDSGRTVMTGAGVIGGAALGAQAAERAGSKLVTAPEWTVRLSDGSRIKVIQIDSRLYVGQHVTVIDDNGKITLQP